MNRYAVAVALLLSSMSAAAQFSQAHLSDGKKSLFITEASGDTFNAPLLEDQVAFSRPSIAKNGKFVGWLAEYNLESGFACPFPGRLVVIDQSRKLRVFGPDAPVAVFSWCFSKDVTAVAFMFGSLHFAHYYGMELRRIKDGKRLATHNYDESNEEIRQANEHLPDWAKCLVDTSFQ